MKKLIIILVLCLGSPSLLAQEQANFEQVLADYQSAVEVAQQFDVRDEHHLAQWQRVAQLAENALVLGQDRFAPTGENILNLQSNFAYSAHHAQWYEKSIDAHNAWLNLYQGAGGDLMTSGVANAHVKLMQDYLKTNRFDKAQHHLDIAFSITQKLNNSSMAPLVALSLQAAQHFINFGDHRRGIKLLNRVQQNFVDEPTLNLARVYYLKSQAYQSQRKIAVARDYAQRALRSYLSGSEKRAVGEAVLRAHLARLLQKSNRRSDADEQFAAIKKLKPWKNSESAVAIYTIQPKPVVGISKWHKNSSVNLSFSVSAQGEVEDIQIVQSDSGSEFIAETKKALKQFYFLPKFVDGQSVVSTSTWKFNNGNPHRSYCDKADGSADLTYTQLC